jgi:hypothetical protein
MIRSFAKTRWLAMAATLATVIATAQSAVSLQGRWEGALVAGPNTLRLILDLKTAGDGYAGTLTSVDQGGVVIPVTSVTVDGETLRLDVAAVMGKYEGKLDTGRTHVSGTWTQGGTLPLEFAKTQ